MPQGSSSYLIMIVSIVLIGIMMWWQSRKAKQQQQKMKDFRSSLEPGTEVITIGGIIGKVVSVDEEYEEIDRHRLRGLPAALHLPRHQQGVHASRLHP